MIYSSITAIGTFSSVNSDSTDSLILLRPPCVGMEYADYQPVTMPVPGGPGVIAFPSFKRGQPIVLGGLFNVVSGDYASGAETLEAALIAALDAMIDTPDQITWGASGSLDAITNGKYVADLQGGLRYCTFQVLGGAVNLA